MSQDLRLDIREKRFAEHRVLEQIQLSIPGGQFCALIGPSGCGKSTLLRLLGGLDTGFVGHIEQRPERIGTLFQEPRLMPWLTVLDNLTLVAPQKRAQAIDLLTAVGLAKVLEAFPNTLSGGMQRRVAIARAFLVDPQLLLMDEPLVSLDAPTAEALRSLLLSLWQRSRCSLVYVTHDLSEALGLADRVLFLSSAPARVVLDLPLHSARPRHGAEVERQRAELLSTHPHLLQGHRS